MLGGDANTDDVQNFANTKVLSCTIFLEAKKWVLLRAYKSMPVCDLAKSVTSHLPHVT